MLVVPVPDEVTLLLVLASGARVIRVVPPASTLLCAGAASSDALKGEVPPGEAMARVEAVVAAAPFVARLEIAVWMAV